jgi:hypothetical protein
VGRISACHLGQHAIRGISIALRGVVKWVGGSRRCGNGPACDRNGHGRIDKDAVSLLRHCGDEADIWSCEPPGNDTASLFHGDSRPNDVVRRGQRDSTPGSCRS